MPLIFAIPMWFQHVLFGVSRPSLTINPVEWFGQDGAVWITLLLGLFSYGIGYFYILKMKPGIVSEDVEEEGDLSNIEEETDDGDYVTPLEDTEDEEEVPLEDQEEEESAEDEISLEDQEEESTLDETDEHLSEDE